LGAPEIVRKAGRPQHGPGDAERHASGEIQIAHTDRAGLPDVVLPEQGFEVVELRGHRAQQLFDLRDRLVGQVGGEPTRPDVGVVHPQPGDGLEHRQQLLAAQEAEEHRRHRTQFHAAGGQGDEVAGDPVEFHQHHADDAGALGDVVGDPEELLDAQAVRGLVEERRQVVHAGHERDALRPRPVLEILLDSRVQVADPAAGVGDGLALDLENEAQDTVRRRVLGTHVDDDALARDGTVLRGLHHVVPVLAADGDDRLGNLLCGHQL
jgi:hypothetical protein